MVVIAELEDKRHHPELGYYARSALRLLDMMREKHGRLDQAIPVGGRGGTVRVELERTDANVLPVGLRLGDNDTRILAVAASIAADGEPVTVVSKDLPMRVKASALGLDADEYRAEMVIDSGYTGICEWAIGENEMSDLWDKHSLELDKLQDAGPLPEQPLNTGVILTSPRGSALATVQPAGHLRVVRADREVFGLRGRSAEQRIALDHLVNPDIGIVSLGGRAGTGKSALALCAGLEAVVERREHRKIMVFRPLYAVGGQSLGFLPGSEVEKMNPWAEAVHDTLSSVVAPEVVDDVLDRGQLEVLPLTHIRGRSFHDAFVIVDEAQSLERNVLLTVLSRVGQNSKVVLTHDVAQRDNLRVGRHDGIAAVIEVLKGKDLFAHVTLAKAERSQIAALVTELLDEVPLY